MSQLRAEGGPQIPSDNLKDLGVFVAHEIRSLPLRPAAPVVSIFSELRAAVSSKTKNHMGRVDPFECQYRFLKEPIPYGPNAVARCQEATNWVEAECYSADVAIKDLQKNYTDLFECLQITVRNFQNLTKEDVLGNDVVWTEGAPDPNAGTPAALIRVANCLREKRAYEDYMKDEKREALRVLGKAAFNRTFTPVDEYAPSSSVTPREFVAFSNIITCTLSDIPRAFGGRSSMSAYRASIFIRDFIHAPARQLEGGMIGYKDLKTTPESGTSSPLIIASILLQEITAFTT
ncbi:hypothetical protein BOTBODRAFT_406534, partial [Botryobasidium botryosum FD-172 SS1]